MKQNKTISYRYHYLVHKYHIQGSKIPWLVHSKIDEFPCDYNHNSNDLENQQVIDSWRYEE
jgi:hypothetical protein